MPKEYLSEMSPESMVFLLFLSKLVLLVIMDMTLREQFDALECQGRWDEAVELAYQNRNQTDALCRCIFYGWYLDLESYSIKPEPSKESIEKAQKYLELVFPEAMNSEKPEVLMEIGYGMNIVCYLFPGDPSENDRRYTSILKRALELNPNDPVCEWFYKGSFPRARVIDPDMELDRWYELVSIRYPGKGEYDKYFRSMLTIKTSQVDVGGNKGKIKHLCKKLMELLRFSKKDC